MPHDLTPREELLRETLEEDEVLEILTRLSAEELGGSESATVAAVSEATGVSPEVIGRMLSDIRQDDLHERYGAHIASHAEQIDELQERTENLSKRVPPATLDPQVVAEMEFLARQRINARRTAPFFIVLMLVICLIIYVGMTTPRTKVRAPGSVEPGSWTHSTELPDGSTISAGPEGDLWVTTKAGQRRSPTEEETEEYGLPLLISAAKSNQR